MTTELIVLLNSREIGRLHRGTHARITLVYSREWQETRGAYPLSISMPLAASEHRHAIVDAFLWGLLPDNEHVLGKWAQKFHVSARNSFALISQVGEDCAGAAQFVRPERLDAVVRDDQGAVEWLDEKDVAERLRALRHDQSAWRAPRDTGQFSLAGAQPKTALLFDDGRWGVPSGRIPTTHILKPPTGQFDGHAENEHFCLALARALGMPTAMSEVRHFGDEVAIVIERYDRRRTEASLMRVHQEDMCQALGVPPTKKYENEGGPGVRTIVDLLRAHSSARADDIATFRDALIFNWLIAGSDAHAKNYSILIGGGGRVRLAPLYDLASALPYDEIDMQKVKLAMKVGGDYRVRDIALRNWNELATGNRLDAEEVVGKARAFARCIADEAVTIRNAEKDKGLAHVMIDRLTDRIAARAAACQRLLQEPLTAS